jgi:hypothetical protein
MRTANIRLNPFAMMMEPEMVLQSMERSVELSRLRHKIYRPLDKPLIPYVINPELAAFDAEVDRSSYDDEMDAAAQRPAGFLN